jgi:energy-coupling factor transport system permease protein
MGLYRPGSSTFHHLNPFTKLVFALSASISVFALVSLTLQAALLLVCLGLLSFSGSLKTVLKATYRYLLFFLLVLFAVQALFWQGGGPIWEVGGLNIHLQGVAYACQVALRLLVVMSSFYLLIATTHPAELVMDLEQRGLPPKTAYVMLATLQAIAELQERAKAITDAQQCRGVEVQGSLPVRAKAYLPIISPLILGSILNIENRALALELRGFSAKGPKTYLHPITEQGWERWARWSLMLLTLLLITIRLVWLTRS